MTKKAFILEDIEKDVKLKNNPNEVDIIKKSLELEEHQEFLESEFLNYYDIVFFYEEILSIGKTL